MQSKLSDSFERCAPKNKDAVHRRLSSNGEGASVETRHTASCHIRNLWQVASLYVLAQNQGIRRSILASWYNLIFLNIKTVKNAHGQS